MYKKVNRRINYLIKKHIYNIKSIIWSNFFQDIIKYSFKDYRKRSFLWYFVP